MNVPPEIVEVLRQWVRKTEHDLEAATRSDQWIGVIARGAEGPVNIGYEDDTRIADLVTLICDVTGRHPRIVFDRARSDGQARKSADATRLRTLTDNYEPRISLREGIEEMVEWYARTFQGIHDS